MSDRTPETFRLDDRSSLLTMEPRHAAELFALVDANRQRLREWLPWVDHNCSVDDSRAFIESAIEKCRRDEELVFGIWFDDSLAGVIGVFLRTANSTAEIGYWITAEREGRGLVSRSVEALLAHLFRDRGLNRVEIRCAPGNARSWAIPERLGFELEGTLRQAERLFDRFVDNRVYALLRSEWRAGS